MSSARECRIAAQRGCDSTDLLAGTIYRRRCAVRPTHRSWKTARHERLHFLVGHNEGKDQRRLPCPDERSEVFGHGGGAARKVHNRSGVRNSLWRNADQPDLAVLAEVGYGDEDQYHFRNAI